MELFLLLPDLQSKNFFYKKFVTFKNESKTGFENRKWNYLNRKWNYFSYFVTSNHKPSFTKSFWLLKANPKLFLKTFPVCRFWNTVFPFFEPKIAVFSAYSNFRHYTQKEKRKKKRRKIIWSNKKRNIFSVHVDLNNLFML